MYIQSLQSSLILCDPMDCSPPGSSIHGIFQARILEWGAMPSSRSSPPRDWTHVISCICCIPGTFFYCWANREVPYTYVYVYTHIYIHTCTYIYKDTYICLNALIKSTEKLYSNYKYKEINFKAHNLKMVDNALNFFLLLLYVIQPVHPKGNQSWIFIGTTDVEAETTILWPPGAKSWLIWKGPDAGKDWRREEKGKTEDEMVGWHYWLNGHESE